MIVVGLVCILFLLTREVSWWPSSSSSSVLVSLLLMHLLDINPTS